MITAQRIAAMHKLERLCLELAAETVCERLRVVIDDVEDPVKCKVCDREIKGGIKFYVGGRNDFICRQCLGGELEKQIEVLFNQLWDRVIGR